MFLKTRSLFATCCVASLLIADPAQGTSDPTQNSPAPRCEDRPTCTPDNYGKEVVERINDGLKRTVENPDAKGRVNELKDTLDCVLKCIDEATKTGIDNQTKDPPP
jgi:hypothetical protein